MDKEIKICPRCEQGYLYHAKPKYFSGEVILCDECYAMWLGDMKIFYGQYGKDFYAKWTLFEVQDSALIKWVQEESCIGDDLQVKQITLLTADEVIDIITRYDPDIELL